ncbi:MAG: GNAT family N-acetyltransferase [Anaerolineales bacterium]|nr:GNAT family N-acetyltransferase [Anaerolineales bacterium]
MVNIFTDTSVDGLKDISIEHYFDSFTCFSVVPGIEVYQGVDMIRILSPGIPNWLTNTVLRCRLNAEDADTAIDETIEYFQSKGVKPYWRLCPGDLPADLEPRLINKGFSLVDEQPAMVIDLAKLKQNNRTPDGFVIERIRDAATMKEKHGWISQFREGKSLGTLLVDMFSGYGFDAASDWQHYLGVIGGKPVSWASVFYSTGVAGIYAVGTIPEARRQGIGSAITYRVLMDARQRGYRIGVLQSSQMGYNMYQKLGFETVFTIKTYTLPEPQS